MKKLLISIIAVLVMLDVFCQAPPQYSNVGAQPASYMLKVLPNSFSAIGTDLYAGTLMNPSNQVGTSYPGFSLSNIQLGDILVTANGNFYEVVMLVNPPTTSSVDVQVAQVNYGGLPSGIQPIASASYLGRPTPNCGYLPVATEGPSDISASLLSLINNYNWNQVDWCAGGGVTSSVTALDDTYNVTDCIGAATTSYDIVANGNVSGYTNEAWSTSTAGVNISSTGIATFSENIGSFDYTVGGSTGTITVVCSANSCVPDSLFYLSATVDCASNTAQVCLKTCDDLFDILAIEGGIQFDDTVFQFTSGTTHPSVLCNCADVASGISIESDAVNWNYVDGATIPPNAIASGTVLICLNFNIIGDISDGSTFTLYDYENNPGAAVPINDIYYYDAINPGVFPIGFYDLEPEAVKCQ